MNYHEYLKRIKKGKIFLIFNRILLFILFILLWQYFSNKNSINSFILSSPKKVIITLLNLYKQDNLFNHIFATISETLIAFIITSFLSLLISMYLYTHKKLSITLEPFLTIINSIPKVSLGPIIIIMFGTNKKSIIIMGILISIFVGIQNIFNGFNQTDKLKIKLMNSFDSSKKDILFKLVIPENKNVILNTLKINISMRRS